jgi:outer membrane protein
MRTRSFPLFSAVTFLVLSDWSLAQATSSAPTAAAPMAKVESKIGFVHNERILRESPAGIKIAAKLEKEFEKRRAALKASADRIAELQKQLERNSVTMPEAERRVKERDLASLSRDFQRTQRELQEDVDLRTNEELRSLAGRADKIIRRIAESEGFDIIFQQESVVFVSSRIDLTARVIKELGE